jgi:hypothetical protein
LPLKGSKNLIQDLSVSVNPVPAHLNNRSRRDPALSRSHKNKNASRHSDHSNQGDHYHHDSDNHQQVVASSSRSKVDQESNQR